MNESINHNNIHMQNLYIATIWRNYFPWLDRIDWITKSCWWSKAGGSAVVWNVHSVLTCEIAITIGAREIFLIFHEKVKIYSIKCVNFDFFLIYIFCMYSKMALNQPNIDLKAYNPHTHTHTYPTSIIPMATRGFIHFQFIYMFFYL